jgi:hypothetical protein
MNINSRVKKLEAEAEARAALPAECTCLERHIEVFGVVEIIDGVAHEHLELTPEQELIAQSRRTCQRDHRGEGVSMTIVAPLDEEIKAKLGL